MNSRRRSSGYKMQLCTGTSGRKDVRKCMGTGSIWNARHIIKNGLLFHVQQIEGKESKQLVLPKARRSEVRALAHDMPCGGRFSKKKLSSAFGMRFSGLLWWEMLRSTPKPIIAVKCFLGENNRPRADNAVNEARTTI